MNLLFRFFLFAAMSFSLIFSACNQQNAIPNSQSNQDISSPTQPITKESGFIYTADERSNSISVVDLAANQVRKIPIGISPHNIQISQDGRLLLVVGVSAMGGEHGDMNGKLLITKSEIQ